MPVVRSGQVAYTLVFFSVDMTSMSAVATFSVIVEGEKVGEKQIGVPSDVLGPILNAEAPVGKPRGADIADVIYQHAINSGALSGTIA